MEQLQLLSIKKGGGGLKARLKVVKMGG